MGGVEILGQSTFRVTRDADLSLTADADDLVEAVEMHSFSSGDSVTSFASRSLAALQRNSSKR